MSGVLMGRKSDSPGSSDSRQSDQRPAGKFAKMAADYQRDNKMRLKQVKNLEELIQFKVKAVTPQDLFGKNGFKNNQNNLPEPPIIEKRVSGAGKPPTLKEVREDPVKYLKLYFNNEKPRKSHVVHDLNPIMRRYQKEKNNSNSVSPIAKINETVNKSYNDFKDKIESLRKFNEDSLIENYDQNRLSSNMTELRKTQLQKFDYVSNNKTMAEVSKLRHKLSKVFSEDNDKDEASAVISDLQRSQNFGTTKYSISLSNLPKVFDQRTDYQQADVQKNTSFNRVSSIGYVAGVKTKDYIEYNPTSKNLYKLQHKQNGSVIRMKEMRESREKHQHDKPYTSLPNLRPNLEKRQKLDTMATSTLYTDNGSAAYPHLNKQFQEDRILNSIKVKIKPKVHHRGNFLQISRVNQKQPQEVKTKDAFMITDYNGRSERHNSPAKTLHSRDQSDHQAVESSDHTNLIQDAANLDLVQYQDTKSRQSIKFANNSQRLEEDGSQQSNFFPVEQKMLESDLTEQIGQWTSKKKVSQQFGRSGATFRTQSSQEYSQVSDLPRKRSEKIKESFKIEINNRGYESAIEINNEDAQLNLMSEILKSYGRYVSKPGFQAKRFKKLPRFNIFLGKNSNENFAKNYISLNNQVISYLAQELAVGQEEASSSIIKGIQKVDQEAEISTDEIRTEDPFDKVLLVKNIDNAILTSFRTLKKQNNVFTDTMKVIHQKFLPLEGSNQKASHYKVAKLYRHAQSLLYPVSEQEDNFNDIEMCVEIPNQQVCGMEIKKLQLTRKADQLAGVSDDVVDGFLSIDTTIQEKLDTSMFAKPVDESLNQSPKQMVEKVQVKHVTLRMQTENTNRSIISGSDKERPINVVHSVNFTVKSQTQGHVHKSLVYSKVNRDPTPKNKDSRQSVSNQNSSEYIDYSHNPHNTVVQLCETAQSGQRFPARQYQFNDYINQHSQYPASLKSESPSPQLGIHGFKLSAKRDSKKPSKMASPGLIVKQREANTATLPIIERNTESSCFVKPASFREPEAAFSLGSEHLDKNSILNALNTPNDMDQLAVIMSSEGEMISVKIEKKQGMTRHDSENEAIAKRILNKQSSSTSYQLRGMINSLYQKEINSVYKKIEREPNIDKFSKIFNLSSLPAVDAMFRGDDQRKTKDLLQLNSSIMVGGARAGLHSQELGQKLNKKQ